MKIRMFLAGLYSLFAGLMVIMSLVFFVTGDKLDAIYVLIASIIGTKFAEDLTKDK
jgi:hypothetical protein